MVVVDDDLVGVEIGQKLRAESVVETREAYNSSSDRHVGYRTGMGHGTAYPTFLHSVSFTMNIVQAVRVATSVSV